ncbi:MAG: lysophospholipid acyltransferase family protein [Terriglobia bacterium]
MGSTTQMDSPPGAGPASPRAAEPAPTWRDWVEYAAARTVLGVLGHLPKGVARALCAALAAFCYWVWPKLRRVGLQNLALAYPEWSPRQRRKVLFACFQNLGRMLADFARFPRLNRTNIEDLIVYDGFEHFARAHQQGQGLIFLTAHFGCWELGSFAHGIYGYPVAFVVRQLDNPLIDRLINRYRCRSGGRPIEKRDFAREVLRALKEGESVGILMDQNMLVSEGVFVDFFGRPASTTTGPARIARKTGAPLVLGLVIWDRELGKYRLRFECVDWIHRENSEEEILANTANFTRRLEEYVRRYPDQWLWVHRRWKTRPPGEPPLHSR